ncbi:MAG: 16S rRNA (cytosine(967)-C(5))-methyltransferase RsmB, partial [Clostridia bacterium]|nr:16S rRNA (cytosine(967)-C(5))-methyltransferase RsmB [Clostridia bacterium]
MTQNNDGKRPPRPAGPAGVRGEKPAYSRGGRGSGKKAYGGRDMGGKGSHSRISREDTARMLALKALQDVFREGAYASLALNRRLRESNAGEEDKRLGTAIFYAAVENRFLISYVLGQFAERTPDPVVEDILHIALAQILFMDRIPGHAAVDEAVKQAKRLGRTEQAGFVNGVMRNVLRAKEAGAIRLPDDSMPSVRRMSIVHSVPEPLVARLIKAYGEAFAEEMLKWKPDERTECIRVNTMRMTPSDFERYCTERFPDAEKGMLEGFMLVRGAGDLAADTGFRSGIFSLQGIGSALAAGAVCAKPGMQILDACAAPGGKACYMAEQMKGSGRVIAWDVHEHRVELIRASAARLGLENIRPAVRDASVFKQDMEEAMDAVLVDAPCSGLGVMINKPDVKYRYRDTAIEELCGIQKRILDTCSRYVKPGGTLVYSTCTVLPDENEKQAEAFLAAH